MGHSVSGFVAKWGEIGRSDVPHEHAVVASLEGGFGLLLIDEEAHEVREALDRLVAKSGSDLSRRHGPVAFVATEYFGGAGCQAAAVWRDGAIMIPYEIAEGDVINRALEAIGVNRHATDGFDPFDSVGLGRYRSNRAWITSLAGDRGTWPSGKRSGSSGDLV